MGSALMGWQRERLRRQLCSCAAQSRSYAAPLCEMQCSPAVALKVSKSFLPSAAVLLPSRLSNFLEYLKYFVYHFADKIV